MGTREPIDAWGAVVLVCTPKPLEWSLDDALEEAGDGGFGRGGTLEGRRWTIDIAVHAKRLRVADVMLKVDGMPLLGLDHHHTRGSDGFPAGYHWDVYSPLSLDKQRVWIPEQPRDAEAAIAMACEQLSIVLQVGQDVLLRRR